MLPVETKGEMVFICWHAKYNRSWSRVKIIVWWTQQVPKKKQWDWTEGKIQETVQSQFKFEVILKDKSADFNLQHTLHMLNEHQGIVECTTAPPAGHWSRTALSLLYNNCSSKLWSTTNHILAAYLCLLELVPLVLGVLLLQRLHRWDDLLQDFVGLLRVVDDEGGVLFLFRPVVHRLTATGLCMGEDQAAEWESRQRTHQAPHRNVKTLIRLSPCILISLVMYVLNRE